jgi:phospholipid/cholesterol/gamma-HCH transport system ATP-binding protein
MNPKDNGDFSEQAAIEFRNVSLSFDGVPALRNVSFKLGRGEMNCITGASGSGKSVLLRLAMGLLRPDEGQIFIEGREIESLGEDELLAIRGGLMGMVFQDDALFTGLTVYGNVAFRPSEHGWSEEDIERAVREVLCFVGLEQEAEKFPEELSGGMRRRLEIARALVGWPSIMLYDEPTSSLDPLTGVQILDLAIRARDINRISSLYVTKELHEIPYLATHSADKERDGNIVIREVAIGDQMPPTRVILLDKGEIAFAGSHEEFGASALPSVTYITHAESGAHYENLHLPDPWSKKRVAKSRIL